MGETKLCRRCGEVKSRTDFHKQASNTDGLTSMCKPCGRERAREYGRRNRDKVNEKNRAWRAANIDRHRETSRAWKAANAERVAEANRRMYAADVEGQKARAREWNRANPDHNRGRIAQRRARGRDLPADLILLPALITRDGGRCWMCHETSPRWHMDHLIPLSANPDVLASWGLENPGTVEANMALACPACNARKAQRLMVCAIARYLKNAAEVAGV